MAKDNTFLIYVHAVCFAPCVKNGRPAWAGDDQSIHAGSRLCTRTSETIVAGGSLAIWGENRLCMIGNRFLYLVYLIPFLCVNKARKNGRLKRFSATSISFRQCFQVLSDNVVYDNAHNTVISLFVSSVNWRKWFHGRNINFHIYFSYVNEIVLMFTSSHS